MVGYHGTWVELYHGTVDTASRVAVDLSSSATAAVRNSPTRDVLPSPPNGAILLTPPTHASDMRDIRALFEKDTCRRTGCDEAPPPEVGRRELEEGDGDHDPDPRREPGAEAAARRLRCVASRRSALDLTYTTIIGTASAHRRRPQRRSRPARRRGRRRRAWRRRRASAPSSRSAARR